MADDDDEFLALLLACQHLVLSEEKPGGQKERRFRRIFPRADYEASTWWRMLQVGHVKDPTTRAHEQFRRRFGVPFSVLKEIVEKTETWGIVSERETDCVGNRSVPLVLKVLGALRMLCKGCAYDAIAELTGMAEQTMAAFFLKFIPRFRDELMATWVKYPTTFDEAKPIMDDFARLGYPGAVGSVDCTHIHWGMCPAMAQNVFIGKEKIPTLAFECVVDHKGRCLYVSEGHPGARSDKTIVKTDAFVMAVKRKEILHDDVVFKIFDADGAEREVRGAWFITDNGYPRWRILQAPIKSCSTRHEMKWATRIESVRKDVECFFGRLKIRYLKPLPRAATGTLSSQLLR